MPSVRGLWIACAFLLCLLVAMPATASAQGYLDIYADFADNGVIDGKYPFERLRDAIAAAQEDVFFTDFANAASDALDEQYLGGNGGGGGGGSLLPEPRTPDESGDPPWPFLALSVLAAALVVTGAGSSIYRRARR